MESYYLKSIIKEIADGIKILIGQNKIIKENKVILYGLDRYSFAMRTILSNLGYHNIQGYISGDEALAAQYQFDIKNFACRFLNHETDVIPVWNIEERLVPFDQNILILIASKDYAGIKQSLEELGYKENCHFFKVYDFQDRKLKDFFQDKSPMTLAEVQRAEKQILAYVDGLCRRHGLRYWVCGGTLLGTIRHKGFIPWDDDIDIFLPWKDYLKLIEFFEETKRFGMMGFGTSGINDFPDPFAKVLDKRAVIYEDIGTMWKVNPLWIDVFPLVGLPEDRGERKIFFARYKELNRRIWEEFYAANGETAGFPKWFQRQKEFLEKYDFEKASYVGVLGTAYGERDCTARQVYSATLRKPFEDIEVNVPAGYKEYLDNLYGKDWIQIPDESKRKTHHNIQFYWN